MPMFYVQAKQIGTHLRGGSPLGPLSERNAERVTRGMLRNMSDEKQKCSTCPADLPEAMSQFVTDRTEAGDYQLQVGICKPCEDAHIDFIMNTI